MAIRDDFTAGEVLAAADLNDTFASKVPFSYGTATPSTTVDGFVWYDENETPPAPKFWDGAAFQLVSPPSGLVHIATESFSAVSSVSLNGCFTDAYANYRILINLTAASNAGRIPQFRLRAAGTDVSANYRSQMFTIDTTLTSIISGTENQMRFGMLSDVPSVASADVFSPQLSANTSFVSQGQYHASTKAGAAFSAASLNDTTSYDGFTAGVDLGTMTGTLRVYGYLNS